MRLSVQRRAPSPHRAPHRERSLLTRIRKCAHALADTRLIKGGLFPPYSLFRGMVSIKIRCVPILTQLYKFTYSAKDTKYDRRNSTFVREISVILLALQKLVNSKTYGSLSSNDCTICFKRSSRWLLLRCDKVLYGV